MASQPMTFEDCALKRRGFKMQVGILVVFLGFVMTGIVWSVQAGYGAQSGTKALAEEVHIHVKVQAERDKHIASDLSEIKEMLKTMGKHSRP